MVLLTITSAVELLVCRGISGCGRPIYSNKFHMKTPNFALRERATILASASDDIKLQIMVDTMCTNPLLIIGWPFFGLFAKNKCLSAQLRVFGLDHY